MVNIAQFILGSSIKISNRFSDEVDRLNAIYQEIESKFGSFQNLELGEALMKHNTFSDNKEVVKKVFKYMR